jgi:spore maturation protein CgeB
LFLEPGREVLVARDGAEVAEHVGALTAKRALNIGEAAYKRVLSEHTYAHRAVQLEKLFAAKPRAIARKQTTSAQFAV